jgi:transposase-like protein
MLTISPCMQWGHIVATLTCELLSAQTVSYLIRELDQAIEQFHQGELKDDWAYLFLDGVSCECAGPAGAIRCTCWWSIA